MAILTTYNDDPPPDDGSEVDGNKITWAKIKEELTDPLKNWIDSPDFDGNNSVKVDGDGDSYWNYSVDDIADYYSGGSKILSLNTGLNIVKGNDIASAASLSVNIAGNIFDVTGTTTITSLASKGVGSFVILQFDGSLTLTHHATDLILPGSANITTAAGDSGVFYEYASGDWRCVSYFRANTKPVEGNLTLSSEQATTSGRTKDFTSIPSWVKHIVLFLEGVSITGTTDRFLVRLGDSGGFETSGYISHSANNSNTVNQSQTGFFELIAGVGSAGDAFHGIVNLWLKDATNNTWIMESKLIEDGGSSQMQFAVGSKSLSGTLTQLRFGINGSTDDFDGGSVAILYQ